MKRARNYLVPVATMVLMALPHGEAQAGGFSIYEQGARAMGRASAFAASPSDASAMFYNPAGLALLDGTNVYVGTTIIAPIGKFYGTAPYPGYGIEERQTYQFFYPPNVYFSHRLNEKLTLGLGVHTPFGLGTAWHHPNTFSGRFVATKTSLEGVAINPTVALNASDRLALGFGLDVRLSKLHLERYAQTVNPFDTDRVYDVAESVLESDMNTGIGFNLGLLYMLSDQWNLAFSYRHSVKVDYTGTAKVTFIPSGNVLFDSLVKQGLGITPTGTTNETDVTTSITFPSVLTLAAAYELNPSTLVELDLNYVGWSSFDRLTTEGLSDLGPSVGELDAPENYKNSITLRLGLEWWRTQNMAIRLGYIYDQSPVPAESISPLLPDANRNGFSGGLGLRFGAYTVDAAVLYLAFDEANTEMMATSGFDGVYQNSGWLLGLNFGYEIGR